MEAIAGYSHRLGQLQQLLGEDGMASHAAELQQFFQQTVWIRITAADVGQRQSRWDAIATEMYRDMRLLVVEVNFAKSAHQRDTRQQRLEQLQQRIERLQGFVQLLQSLMADEVTERAL
ncbi:heterocyst frequency control protein PatD [Leptothoe kymatousa TAU-MAC 1615]|uniref:Heterocyst frequency control protein PatD n=1 Tax=Leptothoe kymatousa TAU-MAC 1615 TaxID=2364775 RepID=A0ABS5Y5S3_9CYAN|nr:heterocyst frequency control protein PatD [Leptothoe kymatousa TAU-MAC 1615]